MLSRCIRILGTAHDALSASDATALEKLAHSTSDLNELWPNPVAVSPKLPTKRCRLMQHARRRKFLHPPVMGRPASSNIERLQLTRRMRGRGVTRHYQRRKYKTLKIRKKISSVSLTKSSTSASLVCRVRTESLVLGRGRNESESTPKLEVPLSCRL